MSSGAGEAGKPVAAGGASAAWAGLLVGVFLGVGAAAGLGWAWREMLVRPRSAGGEPGSLEARVALLEQERSAGGPESGAAAALHLEAGLAGVARERAAAAEAERDRALAEAADWRRRAEEREAERDRERERRVELEGAERELLVRGEELLARLEDSERRGAELLERAVASELRESERVRVQVGSSTVAGSSPPPLLGSSSPLMEEIARSLPPEAFGPSPVAAQVDPLAGADSADAGPEVAPEARAEVEARRAEEQARRREIDGILKGVNALLQKDGYGQLQLARIAGRSSDALLDVAFQERGSLGEIRRFLTAEELHFEGFPGLRSVRALLRGGYEQRGAEEPVPSDEDRDLTWADVRYEDWRELLFPLGLLVETGSSASSRPLAGYEPELVREALNALLEGASGPRRFRFQRLDRVLEGPRLGGIEVHASERDGGGLQVIYEAESGDLIWDAERREAVLELRHGFQRRGTERIPFFEERSRVFLSFPDASGWEAERIPFQTPSNPAASGATPTDGGGPG